MLVGATAPGKLDPLTFESAQSRHDVISAMFAQGMVVAILEPQGPWTAQNGEQMHL